MMRPKKIKLGPYSFTVSFDKKKPRMMNKTDEKIGECDLQRLLIWIKQGHYLVESETLMHESLHAIFAVSGITTKFSHKQEEELVSLLSPYIVMLMRDNPKFVEFILKDVDEL